MQVHFLQFFYILDVFGFLLVACIFLVASFAGFFLHFFRLEPLHFIPSKEGLFPAPTVPEKVFEPPESCFERRYFTGPLFLLITSIFSPFLFLFVPFFLAAFAFAFSYRRICIFSFPLDLLVQSDNQLNTMQCGCMRPVERKKAELNKQMS